jgi:hypothetical protein
MRYDIAEDHLYYALYALEDALGTVEHILLHPDGGLIHGRLVRVETHLTECAANLAAGAYFTRPARRRWAVRDEEHEAAVLAEQDEQDRFDAEEVRELREMHDA